MIRGRYGAYQASEAGGPELCTPEDVIAFWFVEHGPDDWWAAAPAFDAAIAARFGETHARLALGEGFSWRASALGRLAEIIVLDQFSRQLFRGNARAFAQDGAALALAQEAVLRRIDLELPAAQRTFLYLPYMHAESLVVHDEAMRLFEALGDPEQLEYERAHREVIRRFGRFPRRNAARGLLSTAEEESYMASGEGMF